MSSQQLEFDAQAAKTLERVYLTPDIVVQRCRVLETLAMRPGERALDIGIGPGLLAFDLAAAVGKTGFVAGIDKSEPMLAMTRARCAEQAWTEFKQADAEELPFGDESFDAVVSTQVYEYVPDMGTALAEVARVLKPGGRVVILDTHWDSAVFHTRDPDRLRRIMDAWEEHLHDPGLPATLGPRLEAVGLRVRRVEVVPLLNTEYQQHTYSYGITRAIAAFVAGRAGVSEEEVEAWKQELRELGAAGEYFFSLNRYLFVATKS
ncbi:MAG: methyltransferase domain-containing protein [bacterium]|nr:methyltransferase domain-containing protein [bacterium]